MKKLSFLILLNSLVLTGCVTGTRVIDAPSPEYSNELSASGTVYISSIEDSREFEQKPSSPSTPSVKGDLSSTPKEKLSTLIGRQRNGYGAAMGDVALPEGVTVSDKVRDLLTTALTSRGYKVVDEKDADNKMSVDVKKFWAWFSPGMWSVKFESNLQCEIDFQGPSKNVTLDVSGYGINKGQIASDANWKLAYNNAYVNFLENLDELLDAKGL